MGKTLTISQFMSQDSVTQKLQAILGKNTSSYVSSALQAVANNELLKKASPESVYGAVMAGAVMCLPINQNIGHAYIVPYKGTAQLQIGWKGFVQLAIRSGQFATINTTEIFENQYQGENMITGEIFVKNEKGKGRIVGYLAYFKLLNGFEKYLYMTNEQVKDHAQKYSQSYRKGSGVWLDGEDGFNAMAKKTVLKLLLSRFAPLSIELQKAITLDQAIVNDECEVVAYTDNEKGENIDEKKEAMRKKATLTELP